MSPPASSSAPAGAGAGAGGAAFASADAATARAPLRLDASCWRPLAAGAPGAACAPAGGRARRRVMRPKAAAAESRRSIHSALAWRCGVLYTVSWGRFVNSKRLYTVVTERPLECSIEQAMMSPALQLHTHPRTDDWQAPQHMFTPVAPAQQRSAQRSAAPAPAANRRWTGC